MTATVPCPPVDLPALALILASLARGTSRIGGVADIGGLSGLAGALRALGAGIAADGGDGWIVRGRGVGGWAEPARVLELGARPEAAALLAGALSTHPFHAVLAADSGDAPVGLTGIRLALTRIGAEIRLRRLDRLPGAIAGAVWPLPALHDMAGADAADAVGLLLAGLNIPGRTAVRVAASAVLDPALDLLRHFGAAVTVDRADGQVVAAVTGHADLTARDLALALAIA